MLDYPIIYSYLQLICVVRSLVAVLRCSSLNFGDIRVRPERLRPLRYIVSRLGYSVAVWRQRATRWLLLVDAYITRRDISVFGSRLPVLPVTCGNADQCSHRHEEPSALARTSSQRARTEGHRGQFRACCLQMFLLTT